MINFVKLTAQGFKTPFYLALDEISGVREWTEHETYVYRKHADTLTIAEPVQQVLEKISHAQMERPVIPTSTFDYIHALVADEWSRLDRYNESVTTNRHSQHGPVSDATGFVEAK